MIQTWHLAYRWSFADGYTAVCGALENATIQQLEMKHGRLIGRTITTTKETNP